MPGPGPLLLLPLGTGPYDPPLPDTTSPTDAEIADALAGRHGPVSMRYRFERRTRLFEFIDDVSQGVIVGVGQITLDNTRPIARTISLEMRPALLPADFDPDMDILAVFVEIRAGQWQGTGEWVRLPFGLFQLDSVKDIRATGSLRWQVTGSELTTLLFEQDTQDTYTVAAGTRYVDAIATILDRFGVRYTLPAINLTLPVAMTWNVGTKWGDAANQLSQGMGCFPLWADAEGIITTRELQPPSTEASAVTYATTEEPRMIRPGFMRTTDRSRYPNRVVVKVSDPLRTAYATAITNDDDDSPIAVQSRGVATVNVNGDRMADTDTMDLVGAYLLQDASCAAQSALLLTHPDPRRTNHEFYTLSVAGAEVSTLWQARHWMLPLKIGAEMKHTIGRADQVDVSRSVL